MRNPFRRRANPKPRIPFVIECECGCDTNYGDVRLDSLDGDFAAGTVVRVSAHRHRERDDEPHSCAACGREATYWFPQGWLCLDCTLGRGK